MEVLTTVRPGPRVVELRDVAEHHAVADLFCRVWRADSPDALINAGLIRAFAHSGNYVAGAYADGRLVGATVAFLGADHLHSHITGIDPAWQRAGVGYTLKQHQRDWALARDITEICWTFDPLVRRNARFNLHRLGASVTAYLPDFYGAMTDRVNAGQPSDRLYVTWSLTAPRAVAAAHGEFAATEPSALRSGAAAVLLDRSGQWPVPAGAVPADGRALLVAVPHDIEALRETDPAVATAWRHAVREALTSALAAGYQITGMTTDGRYLLEVSE